MPLVKKELGNLTLKAEINGEEPDTVQSLSDVKQRYRYLKFQQKEHLYAVFLNNSNQFIADKLIGLGSRDSVGFDLQDLIRTAALTNAGAVILVHNHPSGKSGATEKDIETTKEAYEILEKINVELLDHVIIAKDTDHSMRQSKNEPF